MANYDQRLTMELQDRTRDLERQCPTPKRRFTWQTAFSLASDSTAVDSDAASVQTSRTVSSCWSSTLASRWTSGFSRRSRDSNDIPLTPCSAQRKFIITLTQEHLSSETLDKAIRWYLKFIESKILESWKDLFSPLLEDVKAPNGEQSERGISNAFDILSKIVMEFKRENLALVGITDALYNDGALQDADSDPDRFNAKRLVFAAFGWITLLYIPEPNPAKGSLQIMNPYLRVSSEGDIQSRRKRGSRRGTKTFHSFSEDLEHSDQPLSTMLDRFGEIIPKYSRTSFSGPGSPFPRAEEMIEVSMLCFYTMHKVASISIEWVDCLSLHLEFDRQTKILKLFRFPSLCLIMCCRPERSSTNKSALAQLFSEASNLEGSNDDAEEYFREILRSYRLIFGQNSGSYQAFNKMRSKWNLDERNNADPVLDTICGQSCESENSRQIWDEIEEEDACNHYSSADFMFLGDRLLNIQRYIKSHKAHSFMSLWFDQRDSSTWWHLWAVIIGVMIGISAVFLAVVSIGLQVLQVYYTKQQLHQ
ncbi:hypothetical protein DL98DRAFT_589829 [Cadophora sp. DSE1049]|nr:hypothetical protein DL98DRAFT_589829 [Cadophora sp. DSE1049]